MNQSTKDTDDILDAIKTMMGNSKIDSHQSLPKDVIELTKPIEEKEAHQSETGILELTELVVEAESNQKIIADVENTQISEDQIRDVVRKSINSISIETIDNIINEELKKVVVDRLSSVKISISSKDNKE